MATPKIGNYLFEVKLNDGTYVRIENITKRSAVMRYNRGCKADNFKMIGWGEM